MLTVRSEIGPYRRPNVLNQSVTYVLTANGERRAVNGERRTSTIGPQPQTQTPKRMHHRGRRESKGQNGFLSWRQLDGERRLTPPAAPERTPNSEPTARRPILVQFWTENFGSAYPMLDLTNTLLNGREAAV